MSRWFRTSRAGDGYASRIRAPLPGPHPHGPPGHLRLSATSSFNPRAPSRMPAAFAASLAPAAVSLFPRPSRAKRGTPISRSRAFTVIVTAGCDLFRRAAASTNVRVCATATKTLPCPASAKPSPQLCRRGKNGLAAAEAAIDLSEALSLQVVENVIDDPEGRANRSCNLSILILSAAHDRAAHFLLLRRSREWQRAAHECGQHAEAIEALRTAASRAASQRERATACPGAARARSSRAARAARARSSRAAARVQSLPAVRRFLRAEWAASCRVEWDLA